MIGGLGMHLLLLQLDLLLLLLRLRDLRRWRRLRGGRRPGREADRGISGGRVAAGGRRDLDELGLRERRRQGRVDLVILLVDLVVSGGNGSFVIVMDDGGGGGGVVDDRRERRRRIRQRELVVRVERDLLLVRNGGHVLRVRPQVHRLTAFRHQIHRRG